MKGLFTTETQRGIAPTKGRFFATLRSRRGRTCHPDPALREKDLFFSTQHEKKMKTIAIGCCSPLLLGRQFDDGVQRVALVGGHRDFEPAVGLLPLNLSAVQTTRRLVSLFRGG